MQTKILVVEDEAITAMDIQRTLESNGFDVVTTASNGEEAIQKAEELKPDLVLMDVVIKGEIDGVEAADKIQTLFNIPVIYLTAFSDGKTFERAKLTKPYGFLTKPVNHEGLIGAIETALYKHPLDKKLAESEERYRRIVETANEGIWEFDEHYITVHVNPTMAAMLGYSVEEMVGLPVSDFLFDEDLNGQVERVMQRRESIYGDYELRLKHKDGSVCWALVSATPKKDAEGEFAGSFAMFTNITKRKQIEEQLRRARDNLEELVEKRTAELQIEKNKINNILNKTKNRIYVVNNDYEVEFINPAMERDFGVLKGYKCYNYFYGRSEICQKCKIQQAFQGDTIEWEQYSSRLDKTYEALATPIINIDGSVSVVLILNDVTERKEAEDGIHRSRESFRTLAENSPDLIIRLDKNLRYVYVNSVITEMTGKSPEYYIGKTYEEAGIPEEYATIWREHNLKAIETGEIQHYEFEFSTINGLRFVETTAIPEFNANGEIESILILDRDITERKETEEQLKKLIEDLKRSNKELRQFAYVSSHDLQEPLRTIASFTQLLQMRYKGRLDSDADEFMGYIVEASIRMKQQILDLLDYSRVGTKSGEFGLVNTNDVLNKIIKSLHTLIRESDAEITYDELPNVMGDAGQLEKIFQNLISNAIKFRKCEEPLKIDISAYKSEDEKEYVFSVSDNGIGIEEQYFERIFTIFQRLHTRDVYKGTGIGLSIIKRIVEGHGGQTWVESSILVLVLPFISLYLLRLIQ